MKSLPERHSIPEEPQSLTEQLQIEEASSYRETPQTYRSQDGMASPTSRSNAEEAKDNEKHLMQTIGKVSSLRKELDADEKLCLLTPRERYNKLHSLQQNLINLAELYGKFNQKEIKQQYIAHAHLTGLKMVAIQEDLPLSVAKTVYVTSNKAMVAAELKCDWQAALTHAEKAKEKAEVILKLTGRLDVRETFQRHVAHLHGKVRQFESLVNCKENQVAPVIDTPKPTR